MQWPMLYIPSTAYKYWKGVHWKGAGEDRLKMGIRLLNQGKIIVKLEQNQGKIRVNSE